MGDHELLAAWRAGDTTAGEALIERHLPSIRAFFADKVRTDSDDLVQRTFERCLVVQPKFEGRSSFRTFLFGIARFILLEFLREKNRRPNYDPLQSSLVDSGTTPSRAASAARQQREIKRALHELPLEQQLCVELYYWHDFSVDEVAGILDVPVGTVKSRLHSARRALAELLSCESGAERLGGRP